MEKKDVIYRFVCVILFFVCIILLVVKFFANIKTEKYSIDYLSTYDGLYYYKTSRASTGDKEAVICGISEDGKQKEILIIPKYIDDYEVCSIGMKTYTIGPYYSSWGSDNLKKIYIYASPFKITPSIPGCPNLKEIIKIDNSRMDRSLKSVVPFYVSSYFYNNNKINKIGMLNEYNCFIANVSYMYNYEGSENYDYYFIDNYDYNSTITYIPDKPVREGYQFIGWYKEEECINKWDFENDLLPLYKYDEDGNVLYQETRLYAKWAQIF